MMVIMAKMIITIMAVVMIVTALPRSLGLPWWPRNLETQYEETTLGGRLPAVTPLLDDRLDHDDDDVDDDDEDGGVKTFSGGQ